MKDITDRSGLRNFFMPILKLAAVICGLASLHGQELIFRQVADPLTDTHVEVTGLFSTPSLGGYHPVRVFISNKQSIPHSVHLRFQSCTDYNGSLSASSDYSFYVEAGKSATHDILVPLTAQNGQSNYENLKCFLSGSMGKKNIDINVRFSLDQPQVLLSEKLHAPNASSLDSEVSSRTSSYSGLSAHFSSRFTPTQLPDDWRAFSGFDTIIMTDNDWMSVPPGSRNAINSWLRLGGHLIIYSEGSPNPAALGLPDETSFGSYSIQSISGDRLKPKETADFVFRRDIDTRIDAVTNDFNTKWPLKKELGKKSFNSLVFIIILITFGIIVGPINLFVFAKSGRRHRLFITTPIISIVTSLILIILIILQDGFGGVGKRLVLMEVRPDDGQNAAYVHQEQISRTGVMTSPGFSIDAAALFVPVPIASSRWSRFTDDYDTTGNYDIQPSDGKLYASGSWFQSRSEQGQLISAVVPTRGRIEFSKEAGRVVSNFDFPIKTLVFRDDDGSWHRADNLVKGKPTELTSIDPTMIQPILNDLNAKFTYRNEDFLKKVQERKGHYIAITSEAPGIETHPSIDWDTTTIITGPIVR